MSLLEVQGASQHFGGLKAVDDVTFSVEAGEIVGLIGPNGAGKTTLFNVIAGTYTPTAGRIVFAGTDITGMAAHKVARLGLARTFQLMKPFAALTVIENVKVGFLGRGSSDADATAGGMAILADLGMDDWAARAAGTLPTGGRKRLELARALALEPQMILLDEVLAGLTPGERGPVIEELRRIRDRGITLLMVEHVMAAVMALSDRIAVLHHGELLALGDPEAVTTDPAVIEAYIGESL